MATVRRTVLADLIEASGLVSGLRAYAEQPNQQPEAATDGRQQQRRPGSAAAAASRSRCSASARGPRPGVPLCHGADGALCRASTSIQWDRAQGSSGSRLGTAPPCSRPGTAPCDSGRSCSGAAAAAAAAAAAQRQAWSGGRDSCSSRPSAPGREAPASANAARRMAEPGAGHARGRTAPTQPHPCEQPGLLQGPEGHTSPFAASPQAPSMAVQPPGKLHPEPAAHGEAAQAVFRARAAAEAGAAAARRTASVWQLRGKLSDPGWPSMGPLSAALSEQHKQIAAHGAASDTSAPAGAAPEAWCDPGGGAPSSCSCGSLVPPELQPTMNQRQRTLPEGQQFRALPEVTMPPLTPGGGGAEGSFVRPRFALFSGWQHPSRPQTAGGRTPSSCVCGSNSSYTPAQPGAALAAAAAVLRLQQQLHEAERRLQEQRCLARGWQVS
jgi:hypothetical protein